MSFSVIIVPTISGIYRRSVTAQNKEYINRIIENVDLAEILPN